MSACFYQTTKYPPTLPQCPSATTRRALALSSTRPRSCIVPLLKGWVGLERSQDAVSPPPHSLLLLK